MNCMKILPIYCYDDDDFVLITTKKPEDQWPSIAHLSAVGMLKSAAIEEKKFKHSPWVGADNPLGPKF